MAVEQDRASRVFRWWKIDTPNDLDGATATVAFTGDRTFRPDVWTVADLLLLDGEWWVRVLVGPGGAVTLSPGDWLEWVRVVDVTEEIILTPGTTRVL